MRESLVKTWFICIISLMLSVAIGCSREKATEGGKVIEFVTHMGEHPGWLDGFREIMDLYEKRHPGVRIKLIYQPLSGYKIWARTQFMGGGGPDILGLGNGDAHQLGAREGYLVPLTQYLEEENPYNPGKSWMDSFYESVWDNAEDPVYGDLWTVPINFFTVRLFYNKDIFRKAGVDVPKTWKEFLEVQRKIKEAGFIPYLMPKIPHIDTS